MVGNGFLRHKKTGYDFKCSIEPFPDALIKYISKIINDDVFYAATQQAQKHLYNINTTRTRDIEPMLV